LDGFFSFGEPLDFRIGILGAEWVRPFVYVRLRDPLAPEADKRPGQVTRLVQCLDAHGLVAKISHSRRWRVSLDGRHTMATAIKLREVAYPSLFAAAA
jgi:hypothetical protein